MSETAKPDPVNHPEHYTSHPSGIECITITRHYGFCIGNVIKYIWRAGLKGGDGKALEDLKKARWYLDQEISARKAEIAEKASKQAEREQYRYLSAGEIRPVWYEWKFINDPDSNWKAGHGKEGYEITKADSLTKSFRVKIRPTPGP